MYSFGFSFDFRFFFRHFGAVGTFWSDQSERGIRGSPLLSNRSLSKRRDSQIKYIKTLLYLIHVFKRPTRSTGTSCETG